MTVATVYGIQRLEDGGICVRVAAPVPLPEWESAVPGFFDPKDMADLSGISGVTDKLTEEELLATDEGKRAYSEYWRRDFRRLQEDASAWWTREFEGELGDLVSTPGDKHARELVKSGSLEERVAYVAEHV